ncbi:MAG: zinc-binding alcohol dehydrogenase family protein [Gammaproteobacteria bacterium]|nr:zinc-binding alcohol dehydrogenase family protein [Gammaproteobacteria bacterium]
MPYFARTGEALMPNTMRAVVAEAPGGPESLQMKELPIPSPGEGQVRIRVAYAPLNPLDTHARADRIKWMHPGFPFVPGYEYSGRVVETGDGVDSALNGKRVAANGQWNGNGEFAIARAAGLVPIPDRFDYQLGSTFSTCAPTSWHLVHSAGRVQPGQTVVLHSAAGAVGIMTTQIAKDAGATVIGLVGGGEKAEWASQFGADHMLDYRSEEWPAQVKELTGGRGADVIVDGVQGPNAPLNYDACAPLGNVIYIGAMGGMAPPADISLIIGKSISVTGFVQFFHQARTRQAEDAEIEEKLATGQWRIPIERVAALDETPAMHAAFENRELFGRTLIEVGGEDV